MKDKGKEPRTMKHLVYADYRKTMGGQVVGAFEEREDAISMIDRLHLDEDRTSNYIHLYRFENDELLEELNIEILAENLNTGERHTAGLVRNEHYASRALEALIWNDLHKEEWLTKQ